MWLSGNIPDEKIVVLQKTLENLSLLIIDEKSFLGKRFIVKLNQNLQKIMGNNEIMGGINTLLLGDNWQLEPVKDTPLWTEKIYHIDEEDDNEDDQIDGVEKMLKKNEDYQN